MKVLTALFVVLIIVDPVAGMADEAYINGHWYDGSGFVELGMAPIKLTICLFPPQTLTFVGIPYDYYASGQCSVSG